MPSIAEKTSETMVALPAEVVTVDVVGAAEALSGFDRIFGFLGTNNLPPLRPHAQMATAAAAAALKTPA